MKKDSNPKTAGEVSAPNPNSVSRIAYGMVIIKGEIVSTHDIRFDGDFEGRISSKGRIIIGESATLKADLICENLDVWGRFEGTATVHDTLSLKTGSQLSGSFRTGKLAVELGSRLDGDLKMISDEDYKAVCAQDPFLKD